MTSPDRDLPAPPTFPMLITAQDAGRRRHQFRFALEHARALASGSSADGAAITVSSVLLAALGEVLRTWSTSPDCTVGLRTPDRAEVRPLVLRRGEGTFTERVAEVRAQLRRPADHDATPSPDFSVIVTDAIAGLDPTTEPREPTEPPELMGAESLHVGLSAAAGELIVHWVVTDGRLPPGMIDAAFTAYRRLLTHLATDAAGWHHRDFDLVPEADRDVVARATATATAVPDVLLHELLAARAAEAPNAEAVVDGRRRLRYGELHRYANRIGARLRTDGTLPGELVAIVMRKGWEQYAAVYGVLVAGGAYLPIDPAVPPERLRLLLQRGGVRTLLTQSALNAELSWPGIITRYLVDIDFETGDAASPPPVQRPTDPAYVIFTSGSTGEPKGVVVDHRGVVNLVRDVNTRFAVLPGDRAFAVSGLHFDASVYDVFGVPAAGATVVLPDHFDHVERARPDQWIEQVKAEAVTLWNSVPALMEMAVTEAEIHDDRPLASLRLAVLSGDWIPLSLPDRLRAQADAIDVVGSGGPTETICWSLFHPIGVVDPTWTSIPYGKPISNQRYYIVDDRLRQRPVWVPGQMAVASDIGLAQGYWRDEERTAAQFVELPETGERAYLTGDIGRHLPDGTIDILGRDDFQVKIQGFRVELGEIETVLARQPTVASAVVVAPRSRHGVRRLHAFVVGDGTPLDPLALRVALEASLPSYLVPAVITVLDALPLTRNGKVDRLALTERAARAAAATGPDQDGTPGESGLGDAVDRLVCAVAADVLGIERVDSADNLFRLGGDSFSGTLIAHQLHDLLGVAIPVRLVFSNPVLADLAQAIRTNPEQGSAVVQTAELLDTLVAQAATAE